MDREQLEFRISQYADGTLPAAEVAALEATLASDAQARALLEDFRKVDAALKTTELPLPTVNWDRLAEHISSAVADEDRATTSVPIRAWWIRRVAMAAAVLIVVGSVIFWPKRAGHEVASNPPAVAIVQVSGPEAPSAAPVAEITLAAPAAIAPQENYRIAEDIIYRPPRVVIASGQADRQDTPSRLPY
jgi:anti-sigma factor RsiW